MRSRALCFVLVFVFLSCLIVFSGVSIKASADTVATYTKWSAADTLSFFGNSFSGNVVVGGVEYSTTFNYINYNTSENYIDGINIETNDVINANSLSSYDILVYKGTVSSLDGNNVRGNIYIPVDIYHSGGLRFYIGSPSNLSSSSSLDPSFTGNAISSNPANLIGLFRAPASASASDYYNLAHTRIRDTVWGGLSFQSRLLTYNSIDSAISFFQFENVASLGRDFFILIATPYSYDDVSHDSPTTTTITTTTNSGGGAVTTGDISVDVNIDLDETNGILGDILSVLSDFVDDILDGIKGLFVPDEDYIENWFEDLVDLFEAKFASSGIDIDPLKNALLDMATYGATTSIRFPGIDLTSCGIPFTISARAVDLQPFGSPINTYIELSINIAATLAVFNLLFTKIKAIFVGERVVEVEGDDE